MSLSAENIECVLNAIVVAGYLISGDKSAPPALVSKSAVIVAEIIKKYNPAVQ